MSSSNKLSGASRPVAGPSNPQTNIIDPYRTLSNALQKPIAPFIPSTARSDPPSLSTLFSLDDTVIVSRLSGKNLTLDDTPPSRISSLVQGKKRNRGNPTSLAEARDAAKAKEEDLRKNGLSGLRKVKKRLGGAINTGDRIPWQIRVFVTPTSSSYHLPLFPLLASPLSSPLPFPLPDLPSGLSMEGIASKLVKADFTGIIVKVVAARNPSLEGIEGIVIEETASTFRLVSKDDKVRVVPKDGTQFRLSFPAYSPPLPAPSAPSLLPSQDHNAQDKETDWDVGPDIAHHISISPRIEIDLLGSNFGYRSGDRAGRKFRLAQGGGGGNGWGGDWVKGEWDEVFHEPPARTGIKKRERVRGGETDGEKGIGGEGMRKRGKSRRKDPLAGGSREVVF